MAGAIIGIFGYQRSGKTLLAYLIADMFRRKYDLTVFTNMYVKDFIHTDSLADIPFNFDPKILLLDEAYFSMDSRNWKDNTEFSLYLNTIGKQNILFLMTAISPDMIEIRARKQFNYIILVKSDSRFIYYRVIDCVRGGYHDFTIVKNDKLFSRLNYDTNQVPPPLDLNMKDFLKKINVVNKRLKL